VNQQTSLQAASPSFELARLGQLIGIGREVVQGLSALLLGAAAAALLMGLIASFRARRYELAVFRMLGASPAQLLGGVLLEGWQIATVGAAVGLVLGHSFIAALSTWLVANHKPGLDPLAFRAEEWWLVALSWAVGLIAAAWPAWRAYRLDVGETLARG
jgi:putative ABC transport system permease protein